MKKKCWPFFHDWETVKSVSKAQLRYDTRYILRIGKNEGKPIPPPPHIIRWPDSRVYKKICLKCGTIVDNIAPQRQKFTEEYYELKARRERKRKMLEKTS